MQRRSRSAGPQRGSFFFQAERRVKRGKNGNEAAFAHQRRLEWLKRSRLNSTYGVLLAFSRTVHRALPSNLFDANAFTRVRALPLGSQDKLPAFLWRKQPPPKDHCCLCLVNFEFAQSVLRIIGNWIENFKRFKLFVRPFGILWVILYKDW